MNAAYRTVSGWVGPFDPSENPHQEKKNNRLVERGFENLLSLKWCRLSDRTDDLPLTRRTTERSGTSDSLLHLGLSEGTGIWFVDLIWAQNEADSSLESGN
jgi:hypothetical protein